MRVIPGQLLHILEEAQEKNFERKQYRFQGICLDLYLIFKSFEHFLGLARGKFVEKKSLALFRQGSKARRFSGPGKRETGDWQLVVDVSFLPFHQFPTNEWSPYNESVTQSNRTLSTRKLNCGGRRVQVAPTVYNGCQPQKTPP